MYNAVDFQKHSETSKDAAENTRTYRGLKMELILTLLQCSPKGLACFEVENILNLPHQTASSLLSLLEAAGQICRNGEKRRSEKGRQYSFVYFGLAHVEPQDRLDVIRKNEVVVKWILDEPAGIDFDIPVN